MLWSATGAASKSGWVAAPGARFRMKRQGACAWLAAAAMMVWAGCNTPPTCKTPGKTRSCECQKGQTGVQKCLPERVWDSCMCSAAAGSDAGPGATTNVPMNGTGGTGPNGSGGSMQPSMPMSMTDDNDAGGGQMPMSTGGSGGGTGGTGSGTGGDGSGTGGTGGSDAGTPPVMPDAYTSCTEASACKPAGSGCLTDATGVLGSACQPKCNGKNDCPVPAGSYTAAVTCNAEKLCVVDCSPGDSDLTPRTCPGALECHVLLDATMACLTPAN